MTSVLGKRKSRAAQAEPSISEEDAQAIFRRHFEAQFAPLSPPANSTGKEVAPAPESTDEDLDEDVGAEDEEDEWTGLSDDDESPATIIEVIEHTASSKPDSAILSKREAKAWLSSRPPSSVVSTTAASNSKSKVPTEAEEDSASLLKNDLALQRLLSESHLFSSPHSNGFASGASHEHEGRNRHLATDLRLSALGSKSSIYKQTKMPMSMRKGITAAAEAREDKRRREAKENGIVLEKPAPAKKAKGIKRREAVVDAPAVGKMQNGMLKLSQRDVYAIQGPGDTGRGGKKKKRR